MSSLQLLFATFSLSAAAFPPSLRYPLPVSANKITEVNVSCDHSYFNATVSLEYPFKGILFAKDFSHECNAFGSFSNGVAISLPTSGCGIRLSSRLDGHGRMVYGVVLVAQQDRYLRQIADQERFVECLVKDDAFAVRSRSIEEVVRNDLVERRGRVLRTENDLEEVLASGRAWMEIGPEDESEGGTVKVGEIALLSVKSTLPAGIGWKVVDCVAHDGIGDSSQKLLDEDGCPIDELLFPLPRYGPIQPISLMRHQEAVSRFAAFKFPDRDRLHLSCRLELCRGECPQIECGDNNRTRLARTLPKGDQGEILDRLDVYNSVEVLAPAIDDLRKSERFQWNEPMSDPFTHIPGDRTFCVSTEKIAITFCILGLIFLCAVIVAACSLIRSRRANEGPFYTRSLLSSSSGSSAYGSKLLLQESPCMGQPPSRGMPYGRIL